MPINPLASVTVSSTAVLVAAASSTRRRLIITNTSANPIRVGNASVTSSTGLRLAQGERLDLDVNGATDNVYAIREGASDGATSAIEIT